MKLKLSDEHFYNQHDAEILNGYEADNFITDGIRAYDKRVCNIACHKKQKLTEHQRPVLLNLVNDEVLKKVLDTKNEVEILPISYKNMKLAVGKNIETLIGDKYIDYDNCYSCFFYKDKFYFFEYLEACEDMGVDEAAYMFVYLVMGKDLKNYPSKKDIHILKELNNLLKKLEQEE